MDTRHEVLLGDRIDELTARGWTYVLTRELKKWYGATRIGRRVWRDIQARFNAALDDDEGKSKLSLNGDEAGFLIVWTHDEGEDKPYLRSIMDRIAQEAE